MRPRQSHIKLYDGHKNRLKYNVNNNGPRIEPCGTPLLMVTDFFIPYSSPYKRVQQTLEHLELNTVVC